MTRQQVPEVLFDNHSFDQESPLFYLSPGYQALIQAYGFQDGLVIIEAGKPKTTQRACLIRVFTQLVKYDSDKPCGVCRDVGEIDITGGLYLEELVRTNGCPWSISACDTIKILDVPGQYRFHLNDPAAVGNVFVYFSALPVAQLSRATALYFGV